MMMHFILVLEWGDPSCDEEQDEYHRQRPTVRCFGFSEQQDTPCSKRNGDNASAHTQPGLPTASLVVEAAGQRYMETIQSLYLSGLIATNADIVPEIKRRIRLAWACYDRFKREVYDMEDAPFLLKVRLLKTEVMETLLYGCVTWAPGLEHVAKLRTARHNLLLRTIGFQRRECKRPPHVVRQGSQEGSVETTIRKRRLLFAGAVQWTSDERPTHRVIFRTMAGWVNPGRGRPENIWTQCLVDDIRLFAATEGSMDSSPLLFGVETVLWPRAAKKSGNWHRRFVDAEDRFTTRWHRGEAERSWQRFTAEDANSNNIGKPGERGGGGGAVVLIQL